MNKIWNANTFSIEKQINWLDRIKINEGETYWSRLIMESGERLVSVGLLVEEKEFWL